MGEVCLEKLGPACCSQMKRETRKKLEDVSNGDSPVQEPSQGTSSSNSHIFTYVYVCVCLCVVMACECRGQTRATDPLELELCC